MFVKSLEGDLINLAKRDVIVVTTPGSQYDCDYGVIASASSNESHIDNDYFRLCQGTQAECEQYVDWLACQIADGKTMIFLPTDIDQTKREADGERE